jgi:putative phosphoribosyl transferase
MTSQIDTSEERSVRIPAGQATLPGTLTMPPKTQGIVVFVHGSGSSRLSPRNVAVAKSLQAEHLGTLLFDLLTGPEAVDRGNVFDIGLLADRLSAATTWLRAEPEAVGVPIGYFGASTGAAAALVAAARTPEAVVAVVSRGGRPDLAGDYLPAVTAPTLLLVGSRDGAVLELNRDALARLRCPKRLTVIPGATHLFEEPGTLEAVAREAGAWFTGCFSEEA